jgi:hypothetical protein
MGSSKIPYKSGIALAKGLGFRGICMMITADTPAS